MVSKTPVDLEAATTLAIVAASTAPLLFLADDLTIIAASASFCRTFQLKPAEVSGRKLAALGNGEWAMPQLASLLKATASGSADIDAYEIDLVRPGHKIHHLVMHAHRLEDGAADRIRLLLDITDVTDTRLLVRQKDDLIREKAVLLQEVQHRVANSLQIIASVLMQSARKVQSEEARGHLHDAHHRVMSIAAVQRQLAISSAGDVGLKSYFTQLCESLGASMIQDSARLSIVVKVDDSVVKSDASISLGLIVTELVINALKHAFPEQRSGTITVAYSRDGSDWTLSVGDDGIGMPTGTPAQAGLGTGIVEALSKQLQGEISLSDGRPGTIVSIVHVAADYVGDDVPAAA